MLFLACLPYAQSQSISGQIYNSSLWHENIQGPPGNGDGQGNMLLGLWYDAAGIYSTPLGTAVVTNGALPFLYGPYSFGIGVSTGNFAVAAWIDGNTNALLDLGEPHGKVTVKIESNTAVIVTLQLSDDNDNDKLPDWWEYHWFRFTPEPFALGGPDDPDEDGLSNEQEANISILIPGLEYLNPGNWDTDFDGIDDKWEVNYYSEDHALGSSPTYANAHIDIDGDGLSTWHEYTGIDGYPVKEAYQYLDGVYIGRKEGHADDSLNPLDVDTDYDMLFDSFEAAWYDPVNKIDPKAPLTSSLPTGTNINTTIASADPDFDGLSNYREQCLLLELRELPNNSPYPNNNKWTWKDRLPFPYDTYINHETKLTRICLMEGNYLTPGTNIILGLNPLLSIPSPANRVAALRSHEWTDPTDGTGYDYIDEDIPPGHDTDGDNLPDGWEVEFNLDPRDNGSILRKNGSSGDPDNDGLRNINEFLGQDGDRFTTRPYINGTGDETNPNEYNHRPDSTYDWRWYPTELFINPLTDPRNGTGISRNETLGSALPSISLGQDKGTDSDDDGIIDSREMYPINGQKKSSPVHSCDPYVPRSVLITSSNGISIPDPEPAITNGFAPAGTREDLQRRDWTLECHVKLLGTNLTGDLFNFSTMDDFSSPTVYQLSLSNNIPSITFRDNDFIPAQSVSANALPTNEWIHIAAVWSHVNNSLGLYINGVLDMAIEDVNENFSIFMFPATNHLALAVSPDGSFVNHLLLDEVRIWGTSRTADQIAEFASRLPPTHNGDDVWIDAQSSEYYTHVDQVIVNGGSLFDGEPGVLLGNVCQKDDNFWIDNGDNQYNASRDTILYRDETLKEGLAGARISNVRWNDKDGNGVFSRESLLAYYRFDDGGSTVEDFARRAKSGLIGSISEEYQFGDRGYALPTNNFIFITNDVPHLYGVDKRGVDDSDGDGMPDAWEMVWHLDPWDNGAKDETVPGMMDGPGGPLGDPDHDGLQNLYEYWAGTNPKSKDSNGNSTFDSQEDRDGDDVLNITEQQLRSRPDMIDTDDDGAPDNIEQGAGTSPADPTDPTTTRAIFLGGSPNDYVQVPISARQRLTDWTIEAWVNPSNTIDGAGIILRRVIQNLPNGMAVNYIMGLETNGASLQLYAGYVLPDGSPYIIRGGTVPANGTWTHIAARYNSGVSQLNLYTNGGLAVTTNTFYHASHISGKGGETYLRIGEDYAGAIDEIRLWKTVREESQIKNGISKVVPNDNISSLAHYFRFDDAEADTNLFAWSEFHQPGGLQDFTYTSDWNEQWRHAARIHGSVSIVSPGAIVAPPSLRVLISPEAAKAGGAQWTVNGGLWLNSGDTATALTPGEQTLMFKPIAGWLEPVQETIILTNGYASTLSRVYLQKAALTVNLELATAGQSSNALWRVDGGPWMSSGSTVSNLNPGAHTLAFIDVQGWTTPALETVVLEPGQHISLTRIYTVMRGTISAVLLPMDAIAAGAQWRLDNGTWMNSGDSITDLSLSTHTVEFRSIPLWHTPASVSIAITNDQPISVTNSYIQVSGLYVTIAPSAAISDGALWRLNTGDWTNSGTFMELSPGNYTVSFSPVDGWVIPDAVTANIISQTVTTVQGSYYHFDIFGGSPGTALGQFNKPRSVAIDAQHNLYVSDGVNNRIQKFNAMSQSWISLATNGSTVGQVLAPEGITLDAAGNVYVADGANNRVQKRIATNGLWVSWGSFGSSLGYFKSPMDVAVDSSGYLYVADRDNNRVQRLSTNGVTWTTFINTGTAAGTVTCPRGLFIDSFDNLLVSDDGSTTESSRIQKFSKTGTFLSLVGSAQISQGQLKRPRGMTMGSTNMFVADTDNSRVAISPTNLSWSTVIGSNVLDHAEDVTWDPRGFLLIADTGNDRILRFPVVPGVETNFTVPFSGVMNPGSGTNVSFTVSWFGVLNWFYTVQYANTLMDPWIVLPGCSGIAGQNAWTNCTDYSIGGVTSRFYRVLAH